MTTTNLKSSTTFLLFITIILIISSIYAQDPAFLDIRAVPVGDGYKNAYIDGHFECTQQCSEQIFSMTFDNWINTGFAPNSWSISIYDPTGSIGTYVTQEGTFKKGDENVRNLRLRFPQAMPPPGGVWRFVVQLIFPRDSLPLVHHEPTKVEIVLEGVTTVTATTYLMYVERGITGGSVGVLYRIRDTQSSSDMDEGGDPHDGDDHTDGKETVANVAADSMKITQNTDNSSTNPTTPDNGDGEDDDEDIDDENDWYNYSIANEGIYRTNFISRDYSQSRSSSLHVTTITIPTDEFRIHLEKVHRDSKRLLLTAFGGFSFPFDRKALACTVNGEEMSMKSVQLYPEDVLKIQQMGDDSIDDVDENSLSDIGRNHENDLDYDSFNTQNSQVSGNKQRQQQQQQRSKFQSQQQQQQNADHKFYSIILEFDKYLDSLPGPLIHSNTDVLIHCRNMTLVNQNVPHGISVQFIQQSSTTVVPRRDLYLSPQYTTSYFSTSYTLTSPQWSSLIHPEHIESTSSGPIPVNHNPKRESQYIWISQHRHIYKLHNAMIPVTGDYSNWFMNVTLGNMNGVRLYNHYPYINYYFGVPTKARTSLTCFPQHAIYQRLNEIKQTDQPTGKFPQIKSPIFASEASSIDTSRGAFLIIEYQLELVNGWSETKDPNTFVPPGFKLSIAQTDPRDRKDYNKEDGNNNEDDEVEKKFIHRNDQNNDDDDENNEKKIFTLNMVQNGDDYISLPWGTNQNTPATAFTTATTTTTTNTINQLNEQKQQQQQEPISSNLIDVNDSDKYFYINEISTLSHFTRAAASLKSFDYTVERLPDEDLKNNDDTDTNQAAFRTLSTFYSSIFDTITPNTSQYINVDHHYLKLMMASPDIFPFDWKNIKPLKNIQNNMSQNLFDQNENFSSQQQQQQSQPQQDTPIFDLSTLTPLQSTTLNNIKTKYRSYSFNLTFSDLRLDDTQSVTSALFDISTQRYVFSLSPVITSSGVNGASDSDPNPGLTSTTSSSSLTTLPGTECQLLNHSTTHISPTIAKSTRLEIDIDQYEATSLFFRFTESLKSNTKYSLTCKHIAISPSYAVIANILPGRGIDHPRSPTSNLNDISPNTNGNTKNDPIPLHSYFFTTPELDRGLWAYTYFTPPKTSNIVILSWALAIVGIIVLGAGVYTCVFRRWQQRRRRGLNGSGGSEGLMGEHGGDGVGDGMMMGTEQQQISLIDASGAFGDDDDGVGGGGIGGGMGNGATRIGGDGGYRQLK